MTPVETPAASPLPVTAAAGRRRWLLPGLAGTIALTGLGAWVLRTEIVEVALTQWCARGDVRCSANVSAVSLDGIQLSDLRMAAGQATPFAASRVDIGLRWRGPLSPQVVAVEVNAPVVTARLSDDGVDLFGLERLIPERGGGGPPPSLKISGGQLRLATPLGELATSIEADGTLPDDGTLRLAFAPARLSSAKGTLDLDGGQLDIRTSAGIMNVRSELRIAALATAEIDAQQLVIQASAELPVSGSGPGGIEWQGTAALASFGDLTVERATTHGRAALADWPSASAGEVLDALTLAIGTLSAGRLIYQDGVAADVLADFELAGRAGSLSGPANVKARSLTTPTLSASAFRLSGELTRAPAQGFAFDGDVGLSGASLRDRALEWLRRSLDWPGLAAAHGRALIGAVDRAAARFDAGFNARISLQGGTVTVAARGPARLAAASGLSVSVRPDGEIPWLQVRGNEWLLRGNWRTEGGGGPRLSADLEEVSIGPGLATLAVGTIALAPWTEAGRSVSANLVQLRGEASPERLRLSAGGDLGLSGDLGAVDAGWTVLSGRVDAVRDKGGWRIQSAPSYPCFRMKTDGLAAGGVSIEPTEISACPRDGRILRQGSERLGGELLLGEVGIPFSTASGEGRLKLEGTRVHWQASDGLGLKIRAGTFDLPMTLGSRSLRILSQSPELDLSAGPKGISVSANLSATRFDGTMVPADLSAGTFALAGSVRENGLSADVSAGRVRVADRNARDPVYNPVTADLSGKIIANRLVFAGPIRLEATGTAIAEASADIDLITLDGTAALRGRPLVFTSRGLQPDDLSARLIGVFTSASGEASGKADFVIDGGRLAGTGSLTVDRFGFQTTRLGRVDGISGRIEFSDLLDLTTLPGQIVRIGSVNPGVPLSDGEIKFRLIGGRRLDLASVSFPFAGGRLKLDPIEWTLGSSFERVTVTADRIDLEQLVGILKLPDTEISGTASGRFPIEFDGASIFVRDARLMTDAGGGRIAYKGAAGSAAATQDANTRLAFDALRDLEFSVLEVGLSGDLTDRIQAKVLIAGKNVRPVPMSDRIVLPPGQSFEFALGFNLPFESLLSGTLQTFDPDKLIDLAVDLERKTRPE